MGEIFRGRSEGDVTRRAAVRSEVGLDDEVMAWHRQFVDRRSQLGKRRDVGVNDSVVRSHHAEEVPSKISERCSFGEVVHGGCPAQPP